MSLVEASGETGALAVSFDCWVRLLYNFPAFLLRILPFPKKRVEEIIGDTIVKMAKAEVEKGVLAAHELLVNVQPAENESRPQAKQEKEEL